MSRDDGWSKVLEDRRMKSIKISGVIILQEDKVILPLRQD